MMEIDPGHKENMMNIKEASGRKNPIIMTSNRRLGLIDLSMIDSNTPQDCHTPISLWFHVIIIARGRNTSGRSYSFHRGHGPISSPASQTRVEQVAREAANYYYSSTSLGTRAWIEDMIGEEHCEWEDNRKNLVDEQDKTWHPPSNSPRTRYTQYYRETEVHWLARLLMA